jgi:hypothetical protein
VSHLISPSGRFCKGRNLWESGHRIATAGSLRQGGWEKCNRDSEISGDKLGIIYLEKISSGKTSIQLNPEASKASRVKHQSVPTESRNVVRHSNICTVIRNTSTLTLGTKSNTYENHVSNANGLQVKQMSQSYL